MKPVFVNQTVLHDPQSGQFGNCFQAVLSTLLGIHISDLPDLNAPEMFAPGANAYTQIRVLNKFLRQYGIAYVPLGPLQQEFLESIGIEDLWHDVSGTSPRDPKVDHACVGHQGHLIHDPHPSKVGVTDPQTFGVFLALRPWQHVENLKRGVP